MTLFKTHMEQILEESLKRDVRLKVLSSDSAKIPEDVKVLIARMEEVSCSIISEIHGRAPPLNDTLVARKQKRVRVLGSTCA